MRRSVVLHLTALVLAALAAGQAQAQSDSVTLRPTGLVIRVPADRAGWRVVDSTWAGIPVTIVQGDVGLPKVAIVPDRARNCGQWYDRMESADNLRWLGETHAGGAVASGSTDSATVPYLEAFTASANNALPRRQERAEWSGNGWGRVYRIGRNEMACFNTGRGPIVALVFSYTRSSENTFIIRGLGHDESIKALLRVIGTAAREQR